MAQPKSKVVRTISDFSAEIEAALKASKDRHEGKPNTPELIVNWYRGIGVAETYPLTPSLYRHSDKKVDNLLRMEGKMLEWFRRRGSVYHPIRPSANEELDRLELLFFMQHYGVPTRLLDWTENPYIGLYFALTAAKYDAANGIYVSPAALWILDPVSWNEKSLGSGWGGRGPLSAEDGLTHGYSPVGRKPDTKLLRDESSAIYGTYNNARIAAQRGVFVIFGSERASMEEAFDKRHYPKDSLLKLIFEPAEIPYLLEAVVSMGFTDSSSYPDLQGLAMELRRHFKFPLS